jgi:hypothetical protein
MSSRSPNRSLRPSALLAAAALWFAPPLSAQEALPRAEVRQVMGGGTFAFSGTGRIKLDRDAFLVVFELGADGRARVLYPMTPRDRGFARADRAYYVPLPSADVPFIRASQLSVPVIVAFASDLQPDLSEFTDSGRRWDYQYATDGNEPLESTIRGLAELLYGSADMPYSVSTREFSPVLSSFAQRTLVSCGYQYGGGFSSNFNRFLWDLWGPVSLLDASWRLDQIYREIQWSQWNYGGWGNLFGPQTFAFARATSGALWDQFGAGCDPLGRDFRYLALLPPVQPGPQPPAGDSGNMAPPPKDRPGTRPPGTVTDVGIELATPEDMRRRSASVTREGQALTASRALEARGPLTRETTRDLVQRQEIERTIFLLTAQRAAGWSGSVNDAFERVRAGQFDNDMNRVAARTGSNRSWTRASGTGSGSGSTGLRPTGGSGSYSPGSSVGGGGGGASAGSGSMSGGSEARGGGEARGGSGRGGTGRPGGE